MSLIEMPGKEIFIVDDDAEICGLLEMALTLEGYRVTAFRDGGSFVAAARIRRPACVLLDVCMPVKSGLDILRELDASNYPAPIVVMSGRGDISMAVAAIHDGACDFVEKRLGIDAIVTAAREAIDGAAQRRQRDSRDGTARSQSFCGHNRLTARERDVLSEIMAGATSKEAARTLGVSPRTIENHRVQILEKVGAKNASDLARIVLSARRAT